MMPRVLNLNTEIEHDVPEGHWSLASDQYQVMPEPKAEPVKTTEKPKATPKAKK